MLLSLLALLLGLLIGHFWGRRDTLKEMGDEALEDIRRKDALEHRRMMERYRRPYGK